MQWKFFLGASFLTVAFVGPHAGLVPLTGGIALGGLILFVVTRVRRRSSSEADAGGRR
jgi:hypothetical protein